MVTFERIILEDCFAYSYLEFDFSQGIHSISGTNGASKTSIYTALAQGLFNRNPKGGRVDEVSNTITGRPYRITVYFSIGSDVYKVVNSRKNMSITIEKNGSSLTRKTIPQNLELIREIIGDSYDTFVSMTYQSTDSTLDLVEESTDSARKGFVNKILKFDELDAYLAESKDKLKQLKLKHKLVTEQLDNLSSNLLPLKESTPVIDVTPLRQIVVSAGEKNATLRSKLEELGELQVEEQQKITAYKEYLRVSGELDRVKKELAAVKVPETPYEEVQSKLTSVSSESNGITRDICAAESKLKSLKEPETVCSRCGHKLSAKDSLVIYEAEKKELTEFIESNRLKRKELEGQRWYLEELQIDWHRIKSAQSTIKILNSKLVESPVANEETYLCLLTQVDECKEEMKSAYQEYDEAHRALLSAEASNEVAAMVDKFNAEAKFNNQKLKVREVSLTAEKSEIEKRIDLLDNWTRLLGSSGYRVHRMSQFLKVLNETMDKYSSMISNGNIKCSFYVTEDAKIEFSVVDSEKSIPFSGWSAGEKQRVKLSCLFAVIELLESMGGANYNLLFLDEVFASLDEAGREGLFEVLAYLKQSGKCIYTISHTPIANPVVFDSTIQVVKENGLSRIE